VPQVARVKDMVAKIASTETTHSGSMPRPLSPTIVGDLLRTIDPLVVLGAGLGVYYAYVYPIEPHTQSRYWVTAIVAAALIGGMFQAFGAYSGDFLFSRRVRLDRALLALAITFACLLSVAFTLKISNTYSRVWAVGWFAASAGVLVFGRLLLHRWIRRSTRLGRFALRTVIVGTGEQARRLVDHLRRYDSIRTHILGLVDDGDAANSVTTANAEVLGGISELTEMVRGDRVDQVFIALPWNEPARLHAAVQHLAVTPISIRLAPDLVGFDFAGRAMSPIAGLPVIGLMDRPISGWSWFTKALEDYVLAALILVMLSPILLAIAIAIKLDSRGPVFFRQRRYGLNDRPIEVWKFRTMFDQFRDPDAKQLTKPDDPRVTRVGRFLRRMSADELPQLINVVRGEMSLVGPRPHALAAKADGHLYSSVVDQYAARHRVKPGITGWAQINGWRGETDTIEKIEKRVEHDLYYIDNWSIWLDTVILVRTLTVVLKGDSAY
jgi:Undecaprenyl-phosphate glucose phosphotransferase